MKTVIEMAQEADIEWDLIDEDEGRVWYITQASLERFAELVRADEREKWEGQTAVEVHEAVLDEREACAVIAETAADCLQNSTFDGVANAIRARSNT